MKIIINYFIEFLYIINILSKVIKKWYKIFFLTIEKYEIKWENIYNQDKSSFMIEIKRKSYIIINSNIKIKYQV